jgi:hypothetical protein
MYTFYFITSRLQVFESVYDSANDFMHNFHASKIGIQLIVWPSLQWYVYKFLQKQIKN